MIISATGIVIDHYGDVLLIERDDTRTLAPPGGAAEIDELPPQTVVREVREETGLIVMAVRLVGLYYLPMSPNDYLSLCFRCIMRGGEITPSAETPRAGFFKTKPLPTPMLAIHEEHVQRSLAHQGGSPYWGTHSLSTRLRFGNLIMNRITYPWLHLRRRRAGNPPYVPPPSWRTRATAIIRDHENRVLWIRSPENKTWTLPGAASAAKEPPWETAGRAVHSTTGLTIELTDLSGVYPSQGIAEMTFTFEGKILGNANSTRFTKAAFFAAGEEPEEALPQHVAQVSGAMKSEQDTNYSLLSTAVDPAA